VELGRAFPRVPLDEPRPVHALASAHNLKLRRRPLCPPKSRYGTVSCQAPERSVPSAHLLSPGTERLRNAGSAAIMSPPRRCFGPAVLDSGQEDRRQLGDRLLIASTLFGLLTRSMFCVACMELLDPLQRRLRSSPRLERVHDLSAWARSKASRVPAASAIGSSCQVRRIRRSVMCPAVHRGPVTTFSSGFECDLSMAHQELQHA
jgi:hypothetical protein